MAGWAAGLGYKGVQIPSWDAQAVRPQARRREPDLLRRGARARSPRHGLQITELSTHLQGQLVAVHPAYDTLFDGFAPPEVRGNPKARTEWAVQQLLSSRRKASRRISA